MDPNEKTRTGDILPSILSLLARENIEEVAHNDGLADSDIALIAQHFDFETGFVKCFQENLISALLYDFGLNPGQEPVPHDQK